MQPSGSVRRSRKGDGCRPRTPSTTAPRHYSTKAFALPPCLATPLSPPSGHPGTPRSGPIDFLPVARRGGPTGWGEGGVRARSVSPRMGSQPPSRSPPRNIRQRVVPGVASPGQPNSAGQAPGGSRAYCLRPGTKKAHTGRPDPGAGIRGRPGS